MGIGYEWVKWRVIKFVVLLPSCIYKYMKHKKQPKNEKRRFEMNGGYFIDGIAYMDCKITGEPVANVSTEAQSVIGS